MDFIKELDQLYPNYKVKGYDSKYLPYASLQAYLNHSSLEYETIGKSFLNNNIYKICHGVGTKNLLVWSQMHGNESTGTRAMFDVLSFLSTKHAIANSINQNLRLVFVPMLNPDGANLYTRRTATGIDMNRDFLSKSTKELNLLINLVNANDFEFLFNLHDQRTIFNVGNSNQPATLSFLAPSADPEQSLTLNRKETMGAIGYVNDYLQMLIEGKVGRYNHDFYPRATGDNFTKLGKRCLLFESGHYPGDYNRTTSRKYTALAIITALYYAATSNDYQSNYQAYFEIPQNNELFYDVIFRNVTLKSTNNELITDIGIQFTDVLNNNQQLMRKALIKDIGDLNHLFAHHEVDFKCALLEPINTNFLQLDGVANFKINNVVYNCEYFKKF